MNTTQLKMEHVYMCSDGKASQHVLYYGMSDDKYTFIPYDVKKKHFCGIPNTLTEKEVTNLIKPLA